MYAGKILHIDLSTRRIETESASGYRKDYIGCAGTGARLITELVPPEVKAFDDENILAFSTGPLTGTLFGNKANVSSRTPEQPNNPFVHTGMGGQLPSEIRFAGYDHILIKGKSEYPVYVFIYNDDVSFVDARHLWGLDVYQTQETIKKELKDPDAHVACIGRAGENKVVHALILHDIDNTASRGGFGAVMGDKNLKAIAVRGTKGVSVANPAAAMNLWEEYWNFYTKGRGRIYFETWKQGGFARHVIDGYKYRRRRESGRYTDETKELLKNYMVGSLGCSFCPLQCHVNYSMPGIGGGGAVCSNHGMLSGFPDPKIWWAVTHSMHKYGIESGVTWAAVLWLMSMFKEGLISSADLDGIALDTYAAEPILKIVRKICTREGIGETFAQGLGQAAKIIAGGKGYDLLDWVTKVRNRTSFPLQDMTQRGFGETGKAIRYRTGDISSHPFSFDMYANVELYAEWTGNSIEETHAMIDQWADEAIKKWLGDDADGKLWHADVYDIRQAKLTVLSEDQNMICDLSGHCELPSEREIHYGCAGGFEETADWISAVEGVKCTVEDLRGGVQRTRTMIDAYNVLCAMAHNEILPEEGEYPEKDRIRDKFIPGFIEIDNKKLREIGDEYCRIRGYDPETGIPTSKQLAKLGIDDLADRLRVRLGESS
ncbi:MAG: aldehyde ferredoxin oxidoreductase N-terminal domain-containing protein [Syntrophales bacterium]|jgi:aldehyde:ferredoxin oxidoreductase|nr:aldehyde ferredoxin oxidoreductase N-terminal domain-containing protein [Syntrophales bacterium]